MAITVSTANPLDDQDILSNERVIDMSEIIGMLETDLTQFTSMLDKLGASKANSSKVEWLEDRLFPRLSALSASATSAATTWSVTASTGNYFNVNDLVRNSSTGECVKVTAISTDDLTVTRAIGGVAAASSASGVDLVIVGNASAQGATLPTTRVTKRVAQYNYTQIQRNAYSFVRTLTQSNLYNGGEPNYERKKKGIEHKRALESLNFFGARSYNTGGSEPIGTMGGLVEYISTNLHDPSGQMTATELDTFLQTDFQYGSNNRVLFAAPLVARIISAYARDNWVRATPDQSLWGVKIDGVISGAYGFQVPVFVKREWGEFTTSSSQYGSWAFVVDMESVRQRTMQPTVLLRNRQANDADRVTEEYLTEQSLEVRNEQKFAIIKNATS